MKPLCLKKLKLPLSTFWAMVGPTPLSTFAFEGTGKPETNAELGILSISCVDPI